MAYEYLRMTNQGIWKIFRTDSFSTPAASYFHYHVMARSFLLDTRVFNLYLFPWQHWDITSERLFDNISSGSSTISNFSCKHNHEKLCCLYEKLFAQKLEIVDDLEEILIL